MREFLAVLGVCSLVGAAFGIAGPAAYQKPEPQNTEITALRDAP